MPNIQADLSKKGLKFSLNPKKEQALMNGQGLHFCKSGRVEKIFYYVKMSGQGGNFLEIFINSQAVI